MNKLAEKSGILNNPLNYQEIAASAEFKELLATKRRFKIIVITFIMAFALLLPILAFYTDILTMPAIGPISWGWVYAFAQFVMTWSICQVYIKKAAKFDEMAKRILERAGDYNGL